MHPSWLAMPCHAPFETTFTRFGANGFNSSLQYAWVRLNKQG